MYYLNTYHFSRRISKSKPRSARGAGRMTDERTNEGSRIENRDSRLAPLLAARAARGRSVESSIAIAIAIAIGWGGRKRQAKGCVR